MCGREVSSVYLYFNWLQINVLLAAQQMMILGKKDVPLLQRCNLKQSSRKCSCTPVSVLSWSTMPAMSLRNSAELLWGCSTASVVHLNNCTYPHSYQSLFPLLVLFLSSNVEKVEFLALPSRKRSRKYRSPTKRAGALRSALPARRLRPALPLARAVAAAAGAGQQVGLVLQQRGGLRSGSGAREG